MSANNSMKTKFKAFFQWSTYFKVAWATLGVMTLIMLYSTLFVAGFTSGANLGGGLAMGMTVGIFFAIVVSYITYLIVREHQTLSRVFLIIAWLFMLPTAAYVLFGALTMLV